MLNEISVVGIIIIEKQLTFGRHEVRYRGCKKPVNTRDTAGTGAVMARCPNPVPAPVPVIPVLETPRVYPHPCLTLDTLLPCLIDSWLVFPLRSWSPKREACRSDQLRLVRSEGKEYRK